MPENFTHEDKALEAKIAACTTKEQLDAVLRAHQIANGQTPLQDRYAVSAGNVQTTLPSAEPLKEDGRLMRRAVTLDNGVVRLIEAFSVGGLDVLEQALRGKRI